MPERAVTIRQEHINRAIEIARAFGVERLILFGSAAIDLQHARDLDLACDGVPGWKLYALGARLEEELRVPLDLIPLSPPNRLTRHIEQQGKVLI
jgi:uncharacterized protein